MLRSTTLAKMRTLTESAMPDTATITTTTYTSDGQGGRTVSGTSTSSVACRVNRNTNKSRERTMGEKTVIERITDIYMPHGTTITEGQTITVSSVVFQVITSSSPQSYSTALLVECVEVS